jgi:repressor of nif and glnA expression|tara:strand:+ start:346 stop:828 length:483 start_codon:yes stop_codon:yes gene_type:complete
METIINRNTSLQIQEQEFKSDRERILDIMKRNDKPLSASNISRITRLSAIKTISVQSARSRLNELKNSYLIEEQQSSINPMTGLNNTTYRVLNVIGSIGVIQREITLYENNINILSSDVNTMVNMMFVSEPSIEILKKQLIKFKAILNGLYRALEYFKLK